jgi:hypothetical protein
MLVPYPLFYDKLFHLSLNIHALIKHENEKALKAVHGDTAEHGPVYSFIHFFVFRISI